MHNSTNTTTQAPPKIALRLVLGRFFAVFGVFVLVLIIALFSITTFICKGPSPSARNIFVATVMETSAAKFLAKIYFTDDEIIAIQHKNAVVELDEITTVAKDEHVFEENTQQLPKDTIELVDISEDLFCGKMMIVHDPSRVCVATAPRFGKDEEGVRVKDMVANADAIAGVNAGGFADINGIGNGGVPLGIVIKDCKLIFGSLSDSSTVIGFDKTNKLIVGKMTAQQALDYNLRDAISFGPVFIVNGKAVETIGSGGGLNPRTVIGQRADGAVLILAIDGRSANSLGATYSDCVDVMLEFGAVNAANLDGGSSTVMVYNGEIINTCASLYGPRKMPTAIIVK